MVGVASEIDEKGTHGEGKDSQQTAVVAGFGINNVEIFGEGEDILQIPWMLVLG